MVFILGFFFLLLRFLLADKYDASEWMFRIMCRHNIKLLLLDVFLGNEVVGGDSLLFALSL